MHYYMLIMLSTINLTACASICSKIWYIVSIITKHCLANVSSTLSAILFQFIQNFWWFLFFGAVLLLVNWRELSIIRVEISQIIFYFLDEVLRVLSLMLILWTRYYIATIIFLTFRQHLSSLKNTVLDFKMISFKIKLLTEV